MQLIVSKSNLAKAEHDPLCSPLVVVVFADYFFYVFTLGGTSTSPQQQWSDCGLRPLRVTKNVYFSLMTHTKQLLLVTFYDTIARIGVFFRTHGTGTGTGRNHRRMDRWTWKSK